MGHGKATRIRRHLDDAPNFSVRSDAEQTERLRRAMTAPLPARDDPLTTPGEESDRTCRLIAAVTLSVALAAVGVPLWMGA